MKRVKIPISRDIIDLDYDKRIRVKNVENVKELKECKSLSDVFKTLSKLYAYVVYNPKGLSDKKIQEGYYRRELAMAKDIRFDYVNKEIFIPLCRYKYNSVNDEAVEAFNLKDLHRLGFAIDGENYIQYNRFYSKMVIWDKNGYRKDTIDIIIGNVQNNLKLIRLNVANLPIYLDCNSTENVSELHRRYVKCCYRGGRENSLDRFFYTTDRIKSLKSRHRKTLKELSLTWYGESEQMFSRGFRVYKYEDICDTAKNVDLGMDEMYEVCRIDFESYLLAKIHNKSHWNGWNRGYSTDDLIKGTVYFLKYKNEIPMVLLKDVLFR